MRLSVIAWLLVLGPVVAGCDDLCGDTDCLFTSTEWNIVNSLSPLPDAPADTTNSRRVMRKGVPLYFKAKS